MKQYIYIEIATKAVAKREEFWTKDFFFLTSYNKGDFTIKEDNVKDLSCLSWGINIIYQGKRVINKIKRNIIDINKVIDINKDLEVIIEANENLYFNTSYYKISLICQEKEDINAIKEYILNIIKYLNIKVGLIKFIGKIFFQVGQKVSHLTFGLGVVTKIQGDIISVNFDVLGSKKIMISFLKPVN